MSDMIKDNEIQLENEEELDTLVFSGKNDLPIFESVRVTKKDFSVYELYRKYKKGQLILDVDFKFISSCYIIYKFKTSSMIQCITYFLFIQFCSPSVYTVKYIK